MFNDPETVTRHPRRCRRVLTKLLYLILMGDHYSGSEASEVFFGVTKLFQSGNVRAAVGPPWSRRRRAVTRPRPHAPPPPGRPQTHDVPVHQGSGREHVQRGGGAARCRPAAADCAAHGGPRPGPQVIIVVSSLTKDMNSSEDLYRGNAIRVLAKIIDVRRAAPSPGPAPPLTRARPAAARRAPCSGRSSATSSRRSWTSPPWSPAAPSCPASNSPRSAVPPRAPRPARPPTPRPHHAQHSPDIVRRWSSEIQDSCSSPHEMVQYHAVLLLHTVRAHDKLAVSKVCFLSRPAHAPRSRAPRLRARRWCPACGASPAWQRWRRAR